jgi:hypothetical protein
MNRRFGSLAALAGVLIAVACSESANTPTDLPSFAKAVGTGCSFSDMNWSIVHYFSSNTQQKTVKSLQSDMSGYWAANDVVSTRNVGYDILREIATAADSGWVKLVSAGSNLTNQVTACMFFSAAELPADWPHDYSTELSAGASGAFGVRGGPSDATTAVLARGTPPMSGIGTQDGATWPQSLSPVPAPSRVLFYGRPAAELGAYEWKAIPANATFDPSLIVGLCDPGESYMVYESGGDILPYADAYFLPGPCTFSTSSLSPWQRALALAKRAVSHLLPSALQASPPNPGGLGGLGNGFSIFSATYVTATATFTQQPHDATVLPSDTCPTEPIFDPYNIGPIAFRVTSNGLGVGAATVSLIAINNNGTPAMLCGNTSGVTDRDGYLMLDRIGQTKTGGYVIVATTGVSGRHVGSNSSTSDHINIRP